MQVSAVSRAVRQTPRKVGLVASLVRGRTVADAIVILEHTPKRAAEPLRKTIESAKANAVNNHNLDGKNLVIVDLDIGQATSLKRYRPAAHGRAQPYLKRSTNIRVVVEGKEKPKKKSSAKKTTDKKQNTKNQALKSEDKKIEATVATTEKHESSESKKPEVETQKKRGFMRNIGRKSDTQITKQRTGRRGDK